MTTTQQQPSTINIEAMEIGRRYVATIAPRYNHGWLVASVKHHESATQVQRDGQWTPLSLVTVTYNNGQSITEEIGTGIAINCNAAV